MIRRLFIAHTIVAASLIAARGQAAPGDGLLGASCAEPSDCGDGLICVTADAAEAGVAGPAGGLCTLRCSADEDCQSLGPSAACGDGLCVEGCEPDSPSSGPLDPDKCHGREDMACILIHGPKFARCTPLCANDDQCGAHLFCNLHTGLCDPAPRIGAPHGSHCDSFREDNCLGKCNGFGTCVELCVIGASVACGSEVESSPGAACLLSITGGSGVGDLGSCIELCNCSSDCPADQVCEPWNLEGRSDAAGACVPGQRPAGASDCLDEGKDAGLGCSYGPVRACKNATCIGTAECLPNGEYTECRCVASPDAGVLDAGSVDASAAGRDGNRDGGARLAAGSADAASDAAAQGQPPQAGCACSVPGRRTDRTALACFGPLVALAAGCVLRRRRAR